MPILAQKKIYIHMPKTGGSWVTQLLKTELGGTQVGKDRWVLGDSTAQD
jgi:hypothetical protein